MSYMQFNFTDTMFCCNMNRLIFFNAVSIAALMPQWQNAEIVTKTRHFSTLGEEGCYEWRELHRREERNEVTLVVTLSSVHAHLQAQSDSVMLVDHLV